MPTLKSRALYYFYSIHCHLSYSLSFFSSTPHCSVIASLPSTISLCIQLYNTYTSVPWMHNAGTHPFTVSLSNPYISSHLHIPFTVSKICTTFLFISKCVLALSITNNSCSSFTHTSHVPPYTKFYTPFNIYLLDR